MFLVCIHMQMERKAVTKHNRIGSFMLYNIELLPLLIFLKEPASVPREKIKNKSVFGFL